MKFLTEKDVKIEVQDQLNSGSSLRAAVAFWGRDAGKTLHIDKHAARVKIVCNLRMGGTNPNEIQRLRQKMRSENLRHRDDLHAKVYLFDKAAIVGSSNASANGLAFQEADGLSWREANVLIHDADTLLSISAWFDEIFTKAKPVKSADIDAALEAWTRKRDSIPTLTSKPDRTLLDAVRQNPEQFEGRGIYVNVNWGEPTEQQHREAEAAAKGELDGNATRGQISYWWDWPKAPRSATFIDFHCDDRGTVTFEGVYSTPKSKWQKRISGGHSIQFCHPESKIDGMKLGSAKTWCRAVKKAVEHEEQLFSKEVMPLAEFALKYLKT